MLSFEYIRYFLEACDSGSIQSASKKLFLSSQGLGAGIQRLESSLGMKLLVRSKTGVMPTQFGQQFYVFASQLVKDMEALELFCEEYRKSKKTSILIGIVGESKQNNTVALCAELYNEANPENPYESTAALLDALRSGDVDAAWLYHRDDEPEDLVFRRIDAYSPLVLICSADNPLAAHESVRMEQLGDLRYVQAGKTDSITDIVRTLFADAGVQFDIFMYTTENNFIGRLIDNNIAGILLRECYAPMIVQHCKNCAVLPIVPEISIASSLVCLSAMPHRAPKSAFFDFMAEYLHKNIYSDR